MKNKLENLEASTSSLQNILVSIGLILGGVWALYTFVIQQNKDNEFSPDVYIEHELLVNKEVNKSYLQVFLVVKNTSVQNLEFKLTQATAGVIKSEVNLSSSYFYQIIPVVIPKIICPVEL